MPEPPTRAASVTLAVDQPVAEVDERFLSFAVDTAQVVGAPFWSASGDVSLIGSERRPPYNFSRPKLRRMAEELAPAYLRIGGSTADLVYYDLSDNPVSQAPDPYEEVFTRAELDGVGDFARALGLEIFFTLSAGPGPRDAEQNWVPDQARLVMEYVVAQQIPVTFWELGNEVNGYSLMLGPSAKRTGEEYAEDMASARLLVDEVDPDSGLGGPSSAYWPVDGERIVLMEEFLEHGGQHVDVVTWHYYPQQSRRCPIAVLPAGPETMLVADNLDEVTVWAAEVEGFRDQHASHAEVWLGETGNAQCGGEPDVSDAFAGGFWWLDELGLMAQRGQPIVVRQTLSGSNYGLIDEDTLEPNPDYFNSLLWRRLMGTRVLGVAAVDDPAVSGAPLVRAYAHCTPDTAPGYQPGAVTVLLLNLDTASRAQVSWDALGSGDATGAMAYVFTAPSLTSRQILLNGTPLAVTADGTPPPIDAAALEEGATSLRLEPISYAFVVLPDAAAAACP